MLAKSPGFALVAVISLALGIGANTAIFSVVDHVLVRTLPVSEPERMVTLAGRDEKGRTDNSFSYPIYVDYRDQNDVFAGLIAWNETPINLSEGGQTERVPGVIVSGNYFDVLGVSPALGRVFLPEEDRSMETHPVAVVSYGLWQRRFGGDPKLAGKSIILNGYKFTVIGVAPAEFTGVMRGASPEIYVPMMMMAQAWPTRKNSDLNNRGFSWLDLMGRLKPGVTREQAQEVMTNISGRIEKVYPGFTWPQIVLADGSRGETGMARDLSTPLLLLMSIVALLLLIACANVANLLLARASARSKEIAVRLAMGASRGRLIRQLMTESLLLSIIGGVVGVLIAVWLSDLLAAYSPPTGASSSPLLDGRLDLRVLGFTVLLSLVTGVIFGLAPALQSSKPDLVTALKEVTAALGQGRRRLTLRNLLIMAQVALSLVVLICAGLCVRSLRNLQSIDAGFEPAKVLVMSVNLAMNGYKPEQGRQFYAQLLERVSALPGVESASYARNVLLGGSGMRLSVNIEGHTPPPGQVINLDLNIVGPEYCRTMKMPLMRGRDFTARDVAGAPRVVIVNETTARAYWPNQEPIGKHIILGSPGGGQPEVVEVIGVVRDSRYRSLTDPVRPAMLLPTGQHYSADLSLYVRAAGDPKSLIEAVRREVRALDRQLPVYRVRTLEEQKSNSLYSERVTALLLTAFGVMALLLAAMGIYGVMAYSVNQRTREIGIRMALGAQRNDVMRLVLRQGMLMVGSGIVLGLAGTIASTRLIKSFLYGLSATDPITFAVVALLLTFIALLACYVPAKRAAKVDPMVALRYE